MPSAAPRLTHKGVSPKNPAPASPPPLNSFINSMPFSLMLDNEQSSGFPTALAVFCATCAQCLAEYVLFSTGALKSFWAYFFAKSADAAASETLTFIFSARFSISSIACALSVVMASFALSRV